MTDKQIIIDGIDVSGCEAYSKYREGYCGWYTPCEGDSCSYKLDWALEQLKAKEQECEKLKEEAIKRSKELIRLRKENKTGQEMNRNLHQQLDQLKAENEELNKWKENIIYLFNRTCRCKHLNEKTEICGLNNKKCISINECMYRKHQTLTEIKVLSENVYCLTNALNRDMALFAKEILQKISECEEQDA